MFTTLKPLVLKHFSEVLTDYKDPNSQTSLFHMLFLRPDEYFAWHVFFLPFVLVWFSPGDYVAACDVSNSSCEEGHDNPREERVLHFTGRERGQSVHQLSLLHCICMLPLSWCPLWSLSSHPSCSVPDSHHWRFSMF